MTAPTSAGGYCRCSDYRQAAHAAAERKRAEVRAKAAHQRAEKLAAQRRAQAEVRARQIKQVEQVSSVAMTTVTSRKQVRIAFCLVSLCVLRLRLFDGALSRR